MARILVVEDDVNNVEIMRRLLTRSGHEVLVAENKQDAVTCATNEDIDLILMDIEIPSKEGAAIEIDGGLQATRQLKSQPQTQSIPVIATSAKAMLDEKRRFLEAGCDDVQSKPYDFGALLESIDAQLGAN